MKQVTAYACEFCPPRKRKIYLSESSAKRHEKGCFLNPENRACASCGLNDWNRLCIYRAGRSEENPKGLRKNCPMWRKAVSEGVVA